VENLQNRLLQIKKINILTEIMIFTKPFETKKKTFNIYYLNAFDVYKVINILQCFYSTCKKRSQTTCIKSIVNNDKHSRYNYQQDHLTRAIF